MPRWWHSPTIDAVSSEDSSSDPLISRWPLLLRGLWLVVGVSVLGSVAAAMDVYSSPVRLVALGWIALAWGLGLVAVLVPHPIGLTCLRCGVMGMLGFALWASVTDANVMTAGAAALTIMVAVVVFAAPTGEWCVDGPAYPNEQRFPLRPPVIHQWVTAPIVGALMLTCLIGGPLLLAARSWVAGAIVCSLGIGAVLVGGRSLHELSRRFVVFVPAGFVVHDYFVLREPVLFKRAFVEGIGLTPEGSSTLDLTAQAAGMSIDVLLEEKVEITRLSADRRTCSGWPRPGRAACLQRRPVAATR
jgi:hypothetical protein